MTDDPGSGPPSSALHHGQWLPLDSVCEHVPPEETDRLAFRSRPNAMGFQTEEDHRDGRVTPELLCRRSRAPKYYRTFSASSSLQRPSAAAGRNLPLTVRFATGAANAAACPSGATRRWSMHETTHTGREPSASIDDNTSACIDCQWKPSSTCWLKDVETPEAFGSLETTCVKQKQSAAPMLHTSLTGSKCSSMAASNHHGKISSTAEEAARDSSDREGSQFRRAAEARWAYFSTLWGMSPAQMLRGTDHKACDMRTLPFPYFQDAKDENEFVEYILSILPLRVAIGALFCFILELSEIILAAGFDYKSKVQDALHESYAIFLTSNQVFIVLQPVVWLCLIILTGIYAIRKKMELITTLLQALSGILCLINGVAPTVIARGIMAYSKQRELALFVQDRGLDDTLASVAVQILVYNLLFPIRLKVSWPVTLLYLAVAFTVFILALAWGPFDFLETGSAVSYMVWTIIIAVICLTTKYERELNTRAVWLDWKNSTRRVEELERRFLRPTATPEAGLETVNNCIRSAMEVLQKGKQQGKLTIGELEDIERVLLPATTVLMSRRDPLRIRHSELGTAFCRDFMKLFGEDEEDGTGPARNLSGFSVTSNRSSSKGLISRPPRVSLPVRIGPQGDVDFFAEVGREWCLDLLKHQDLDATPVFVQVGRALLLPYTDSPHIRVPEPVVDRFLGRVHQEYLPNPYHNSAHGAQVAHLTFCLLSMVALRDLLRDTDEVGIAIATLCHDIGHPGRSNQFLINIRHPLATTYNDNSVLENFHAASLFRILSCEKLNVLFNLPDDTFREMRKVIISIILATDMKRHFEEISLFRTHRKAPCFKNYECADDIWMVVSICVKAADLGHAALPWEQHLRWSKLLTDELFLQGDDERARDQPVSFLCDRVRDADISKSQVGFLEFVVLAAGAHPYSQYMKDHRMIIDEEEAYNAAVPRVLPPLLTEVSEIQGADEKITKVCIARLEKNLQKWRDLSGESGDEKDEKRPSVSSQKRGTVDHDSDD